jgi:hypothetical protein
MAESRYQVLAETKVKDDLVWVKDVAGDPYIFRAPVVEIDAPLDVVWGVVCNLNQYHEYSNQTVDVNLTGELTVGAEIDIRLYPGTLKGFFIPTSKETINVVLDDDHILCWTRKLPCSSLYSQRYHVLESIPENQSTRSYIALHIPGNVGFFSRKFLGTSIEQALGELNEGIKKKAESEIIYHF